MKAFVLSRIRKAFGIIRHTISSMAIPSTRNATPIRQTKLAPDGLEFCEDVSDAMWVQESLADFGTLRSLLPSGFPAYARVFHPAYLGDGEDQPVRWSTVASWTGRTVHPLMQFERIAGLSEEELYPDPPWGSHPQEGSIPESECRTLVEVLRGFTSTPGNCLFCIWDGYSSFYLSEGYSNESYSRFNSRRYKADSRLRTPNRDYLLFRGPLDKIMAFLGGDEPFWENSPNIWWPEDRAWCVATDIDLFDTYVGGNQECIEAVLSNPDLEVLRTTLDARVDIGGDTINAPDERGGRSQ